MTEDTADGSWPAVSFETVSWHASLEEFDVVPKSRRRALAATYEAAIPASIAEGDAVLPQELLERMGELGAALARFDAEQEQRGYDLPALMLRSESSASSQIEHLTSSARNIALAGLSSEVSHNARLIAGNVSAMRTALACSDEMSVSTLLDIHRVLMLQDPTVCGGELRSEQVWVGGTSYSPHGALFVPPVWERVPSCLDDLFGYMCRDDVPPVVQAAIAHAQFETIHPFIDGNGRTGRVLLHKVLRRRGVLVSATLPISAGLLHSIDSYMGAIKAYQGGDVLPIVEQFVLALEMALSIGISMAREIDEILDEWRSAMRERAGSSIFRLPSVLVEQPVINTTYLAERLDVTDRAARSVIDRACEYGMLRPMGNKHRGVFYQADAILDVLEAASAWRGMRREVVG